jgi:hypothetical protein
LTPHSSADNLKAAKAFDQLFDGASTFFAKLPANSYAATFSEIGKNHFFSKMQQQLSVAGSPADWQAVENETGNP